MVVPFGRNGSLFLGFLLMVSGAWGGNELTDAAITAQVESRFVTDARLNPLDINTTTVNGVVTLSGTVSSQAEKEAAEELARRIQGVKNVVNNLVVVSGPRLQPQKRSIKQVFSDRALATAIRSRLLYHKEFESLAIDVTCRAGVVYLYGTVHSEETLRAIEKVVQETRGVVAVENKLKVVPPVSGTIPQKSMIRLTDNLIEKRVEAALLMNRHVMLRDLNVSVDNGVCFLSGSVGSTAERDAAEAIAASILGVKSVVNNIEIYSESVFQYPSSGLMEPLEVPIE